MPYKKQHINYIPTQKQKVRMEIKKKNAIKKKRIKLGLCALIILIFIYLAGVIFYSNNLFPNTYYSENNYSLFNKTDFKESVNNTIKNFSIDVDIFGEEKTTLEHMRLHQKINDSNFVNDMELKENAWSWPINLFNIKNNFEFIDFDENYVSKKINDLVNTHNNNCTKCSNATLSYSNTTNEITINEAIEGNEIDSEKVYNKVKWAINNSIPNLLIDESFYKKPKVYKDNPKLKNSLNNTKHYLNKEIKILINDIEVENINSTKIFNWLVIDDDANINLNESAIYDDTVMFCKENNTLGSKRSYIRPDGKICNVEGGTYGFEIDEDDTFTSILDKIKNDECYQTIEVKCTPGAYNYTGKNKQDWGNTYIDVDLNEQKAYMFKNNNKIWESPIVSGKPNENTPEGAWYITNKQSPSKLIGEIDNNTNKPSYETEVQFWMPFVENIIGLHDAPWQTSFGGSRWSNGYGSRGCINLPTSKASELYKLSYKDLPVIVHY